MASRLYSTTRRLYVHVAYFLGQLGVNDLGTPTMAALIALYVTGLILFDTRQTQTRVTRFLPGRCHDALNRLLRVMPLSTRTLMALLIRWVKRQGRTGYLCLDDVIVEKAFATKLPWAGWTYSSAKKRAVYGLHIVVLLWCSTDRCWRIPVSFRIWRPKRRCAKHDYRTKLQLAEQIVKEVITMGLAFDYISFDNHYTAGWFTKMVARLGYKWVGVLESKATVVWHGQKMRVSELAERLKLKWRKKLGLRAKDLRVYAPKYGELKLVLTRNSHGNFDYVVSNDLGTDLTTQVQRKRSRWSIETIFRDTKQFAGLESCQCWVDQAMVRHVTFVLMTFVVLQMMRVKPDESVGTVKERWQLDAFRNGELPPSHLKACPAHLRPTA